ncbi:MAG: hypothetical protein SOI44_01545 [Lactimicrobium sp.]|jgi:tetratricopeptide (TPR) repeat protein|uniref:tetratricopeptide repeat protein n=1 Tax=Lactimicrobium sp. TaxID=2563780 RepID=UPI002F34F043
MSRDTERAIKELYDYIEKHGGADTEEDLRRLTNQFMMEYNASLPDRPVLDEDSAETSDDWMELAEETDDKDDAIRYARNALSLDPDNLDAETMIAFNTEYEDVFENLLAMRKVCDHGEKLMRQKGYLDKDVGDFWMILETRPYIRALGMRMKLEIYCGMYRLAEATGEEIIRLNNNDNTGARLALMSLYATTLDQKPAEKLYERFSEYGPDSSMLLALSALYFRLGNFDKAEETLRDLQHKNKDTRRFFKALIDQKIDDCRTDDMALGYQPGTISELITIFDENSFLWQSEAIISYYLWSDQKLKPHRKLKKRRK